MDNIADMISLVIDQSEVHTRNGGCVGLPFCVSCRSSALLNNDMSIPVAEAWINAQEPGTVVYWTKK